MGFFGTIAKLAGKVVKTGASVLTHGTSDLLLKQLKGTGQVKQAQKAVAARQMTAQQLAAATAVQPSVKVPAAQKVQAALRPLASAAKRAPQTREKVNRKGAKSAPGFVAEAKRQLKARKAKKPSNRKPPKGGLDLAAIARAWRAAGKPGTWLGYIKANPIRKK